MKKMMKREVRTRPKCGAIYNGIPAISRVNGELICSNCGIREALVTLNLSANEIEEIIDIIYEHSER